MTTGYLYVDHESDLRIPSATTGFTIRRSPRPPWLVVYHSIEKVLLARWPGRLFRVLTVDPASERAEVLAANRDVSPSAGYSRATAVEIIEEISTDLLFGPHGAAVAHVAHVAGTLTVEEAESLAANSSADASAVYSDAWRRWLAVPDDEDYTGTLSVFDGRSAPSPIGDGLTVVHQAVWEAARLRCGDSGFTVEGPPEDGEVVLSEPWAAAGRSLVEAALALGAPELVGDGAAVLTVGWRALPPGRVLPPRRPAQQVPDGARATLDATAAQQPRTGGDP